MKASSESSTESMKWTTTAKAIAASFSKRLPEIVFVAAFLLLVAFCDKKRRVK